MLLPVVVSALLPQGDFEVPPGFSVSRASAASHSYLAVAVDPHGAALLSTEEAGLLRAIDGDGDGFHETVEPLTGELTAAQGLCYSEGSLFVVGRRVAGEGPPASGLWRLELSADGGTVTGVRLLVPIDDDDEHGAHGVIAGTDGDLYVVVGDRARFTTEPENAGAWDEREPGSVLPVLPDPSGFDQRRRWPFGFVARVDADTGRWSIHSAGYRNPYDLAFTESGELVTVESDMEWDAGLPWYRPVRALRCPEGADHGAADGSGSWREHWGQSPASLVDLGRASPTGVLCYDAGALPARYRGAVLAGDWTNARILALHLTGEGAAMRARAETLVQAAGALNVTDLAVAADGSVLFVTGGRATAGALFRLSWDSGAPAPPPAEPPAPASDAELAERRARAADVARLRERQRAVLAGTADRVEAGDEALAAFPSGDRARDEELAVLLAVARPDGAIDALLAELDAGGERSFRIHLADCLRSIDEGWTTAARARLIAFFEEAAGWPGGGNLQGYLDLMLAGALEELATEDVRALEAAGALGPRSLATLVARRGAGQVPFLLDPLRDAFAALDEDDDVVVAQERKRALLRSLAGASSEELLPWLRAVHAREPALRDDVLVLLADASQREDFERFVDGLARSRRDVRTACVSGLLRLGRRPTDPDTYRRVLDLARAAGPRGGRKLLRVLSHWGGGPTDAPGSALWAGELAEWERWFARIFPEYVRGDRGPLDGPAWDLEEIAGFLERTAGRPASAARGAAVFTRTSCHTCHTLGAIGTGWAPDLTGVTRRFSTRELLETITDPSRVIAERYATTEVATVAGELLEGRLVRESADELVLLDAGGARTTIAREDVASLAPSAVSAMPEGLLADVTLEEVRDLVAYLAADGAVDPAAALEPGWVDLLEGAQRRHWTGSFDGWTHEGRVLVGRAKDLKRSSYLVYDVPHADFELELDVFTDGNSGVQYRSRVVEGKMDPVGYQADLGKLFWGSLYGTDGRGKLAGPSAERFAEAVRPDGWNHLHLRVEGDRHVVELNGYPMVDVRDDAFGEGVLAFQLHQRLDMVVAFTNSRIRTLRR